MVPSVTVVATANGASRIVAPTTWPVAATTGGTSIRERAAMQNVRP